VRLLLLVCSLLVVAVARRLVAVYDGIIVALARGARKAARAAARRLGTPALKADFELTKLYGSRAAKSVKGEVAPGGKVATGGGA
jgi:hypothetical protein